MIAALRFEWVRVTTVRSTKICLVLALVLAGLLGYGAANPHQDLDEFGNSVGPVIVDWYNAFSIPLMLSVVLVSVVAAQSIGQEYRFGLIRLTLTAFPKRAQIMTAKLALVALVAVVFALTSYAGSWIGLVLRGFAMPPEGTIPPDSTFFFRGVVFVVLWALSAFALAGITRQTAIGIAVPLVSGVILEQILAALLSSKVPWLTFHLPWSSAGRWAQQPISGDPSAGGGGAAFGELDVPVGWAAVGVFAVWVLVLLALEVVAFLRRDA